MDKMCRSRCYQVYRNGDAKSFFCGVRYSVRLQFLSIMRYRTEYVDESAVLVRSDLLVCSAMSCAMLFIMYALYTRVRLLY